MTTASNAINTNLIDTVTVGGTLTIGGTNTTSVDINENVTVSGTLGATTVTATGGITTPSPITLSYSVLPTFTPDQIGYQAIRTLASNVLIPISSSNTDVTVPFDTPNPITFPVGVWNVSFVLSIASLTASPASTSITTYQTFAYFPTPVLVGTQRLPQKLGFTNMAIGGSPITVVLNNVFSINDSITFQNDEPNNQLTLIFRLIFTNAPGGDIYIQGSSDGSPSTPNTFLVLTRIA